MVIAELNPEAPVATNPNDKFPIKIQGVRDAGGPASGEPVSTDLTVLQAKWLIKRLEAAVESLT